METPFTPDNNDPKDKITSFDDYDCKAIYKGEDCPPCKEFTYTKKYLTSSVFINNVAIEPGNYCVRNNVPKCHPDKGVLIIDDQDLFKCICKYPNYFNGVDCSKQVACTTHFGKTFPLVDSKGNKVSGNLNYYEDKIKCDCGEDVLKMATMGFTNCVIDPCLYPLPKPAKKIIGYSNGKCKCDLPLKNVLGSSTPCSSCVFNLNLLKTNTYVFNVPLKCFNNFHTSVSLSMLYPCSSMELPSSCGNAKVFGKRGKNFRYGSMDNLSKMITD